MDAGVRMSSRRAGARVHAMANAVILASMLAGMAPVHAAPEEHVVVIETPGASWTYTAAAAGSYTYACRYQPGMTATLVIR